MVAYSRMLEHDDSLWNLMKKMTAAGMAASLAELATIPIDTAKVRLQVSDFFDLVSVDSRGQVVRLVFWVIAIMLDRKCELNSYDRARQTHNPLNSFELTYSSSFPGSLHDKDSELSRNANVFFN